MVARQDTTTPTHGQRVATSTGSAMQGRMDSACGVLCIFLMERETVRVRCGVASCASPCLSSGMRTGNDL